jgi:PilZ domain
MSFREGGEAYLSPAVVVVLVAVALAFVAIVIWRARAEAPAEGSLEGTRVRTLSAIRRERRKHSRIVPTPDKPAELQIMGKDFLEIPEVRDISENGLAISVPHKFNGHKPTQEVDLLLTLHGQGTVRAKGAIRRVSYTRNDTATFGVELVDIDEQDRAKIRNYVAKVQEGVPEPVDASQPTPLVPSTATARKSGR